MSRVMMQLGLFQFSVNTAAYTELTRSDEYKWAEIQRINNAPLLQYTGRSAKKMELRGVIFPQYLSGRNQLTYIRLQAELAVPLVLVSGSLGLDNLFGRWVVESITEDASVFLSDGTPRRQGWRVTLKQYDDGLREVVSAVTGIIQKF